jgi:hypothetical protein
MTTTMRHALVSAGVGCRKVRHDSRYDAEMEIERMVKRGRDTDPSRPLHAWHCDECDGWHVGHRRDLVFDAPEALTGLKARGSTRPAGFKSSMAAVVDAGKYQPEPRTEYWTKGKEIEMKVITDHSGLRDEVSTLPAGRLVYVVGGPSGFYDQRLYKMPERVAFLQSTETKASDAGGFSLPSRAAVVILTKFVSVGLGREVAKQCEARGIPLYGVFKSPGAVNRALAFLWEKPTPAEPPVEQAPAPVQAVEIPMPTPTTAPSDDSLPVSGDTIGEDDLSRVFGDLEAAVALARDAALAAVRAAVRLRREADAMKQLKALLKTLD